LQEPPAAFTHEIRMIKTAPEIFEPTAQLRHAHRGGLKINVKQGATVPAAFGQQPARFSKTLVQRRARERSEKGNLHIVEAAFAHEIENLVKLLLLMAGTVQAHDKTAVHGNASALNPFDGSAITFSPARFPITALLDTVQDSARWTFEADQDLGATGVAHQPQ
jgi:hypothetical protein